MRRSPAAARGLLLALAGSSATGCTQTDLVARAAPDACVGEDCGAPGSCTGEGCSACLAQGCAELDDHDALCAASALPLRIGDSCTEAAQPAQAFRFALCTCSDLVASEPLRVDALSGMPAARVGINGSARLDRGGSVAGSVYVAGTISQGAELSVAGEQLTRAPAPCACAPQELLDIAGLVRARREDNDNAAHALDPRALEGFSGERELSLPCGRYFLTRLSGTGPLTIHAQGNVLLFVEGNIELDDALNVDASDGGQAALVVAGDMRVAGATFLGGDPGGDQRVSLLLASSGSLNLSGSTRVVGDIYAPRADLVTTGSFEQYGSLFVHRAAPGGELILHQDLAAPERAACAPSAP